MRLEEGQVAVVTGAASGIGFALCAELGARGLSVVLVDIDQEMLDRAANLLAERGVTVQAVATDVSDADAVDALAARVLDEFGRADVVCSNAGVLTTRTVAWDVPDRDVRWLYGVNVFGVYNMLRAFTPALIAQGTGHIVHTASNVGLDAVAGLGLYGATKHAVVGLTFSLMAELELYAPGVGVTLLCPGATVSNLHQAERHRPSSAAPSPDLSRWTAPASRDLVPIPAASVARQVITAIERGQRLIVTDDDAVAGIRRWLQAIESDLLRSPADALG
jgi:NAD(P)-dependent dehydrogenase (short-subunit alcohol dehydrogenase family)